MRLIESPNQIPANIPDSPELIRSGFIYLVKAETVVKLGASQSPAGRIASLAWLGPRAIKERASVVYISAPIFGFGAVESAIHAASRLARRYEKGKVKGYTAEYYHAALMPALRTAVELAEKSDCGNFAHFMDRLYGIAEYIQRGKPAHAEKALTVWQPI